MSGTINVESEIAKMVEANGAVLYDIEVVSQFDETIYRVSITKQGGVSIDLCEQVSHDLSPFLDVHPPLHGEYRLEVSSPGIERKLSKPSHFQQAIGEKVKVKVKGGDKLKGELVRADENGFVVRTKHDDEAYSYVDVGTVKTYFEF
jgi:ribosome maturation factor RimP